MLSGVFFSAQIITPKLSVSPFFISERKYVNSWRGAWIGCKTTQQGAELELIYEPWAGWEPFSKLCPILPLTRVPQRCPVAKQLWKHLPGKLQKSHPRSLGPACVWHGQIFQIKHWRKGQVYISWDSFTYFFFKEQIWTYNPTKQGWRDFPLTHPFLYHTGSVISHDLLPSLAWTLCHNWYITVSPGSGGGGSTWVHFLGVWTSGECHVLPL